jgi:phage virion morphogenesis protein
MAAEGIRIVVTEETISAALSRVDRVADNPGAIMSDISGYLVTSTQRHFERETGPDGKWPKLSARTAAKRVGRGRRRGYENMLRVTNRLYSSIVGDSTATEAIVGSNAIYAALQNLGGTIQIPERQQDIHLGRTNRGKRFVKASARRKETRRVSIKAHQVTVPARTFLYLSDEDVQEIERIVAEGFRREADLP